MPGNTGKHRISRRTKIATGTFTVDCGRNENQHFNPDNFVAQPGVRNGAQHLHDYADVMSPRQMNQVVNCINRNKTCNA